MYLNRLEIQGFKSFADRVEVEFGPGITVIVGPNGCGKSNLIEAVQWVLGEQNVRALRGYKMDDVIFSGTTRRRSLGMAEVSITLDNTTGVLPLPYQEVRITRRVYRSGESEYFINKSPCRLRDIQELFSACGIGRAAFFIIPQGKIEEFVFLHPEERRLYLEEAAGVSKYQRRKAEAVKKLEETEKDLVRLRDILEELERQRLPLAEQAKTAELYHRLRHELRSLEVRLLEERYFKVKKRKEFITKTYQEIGSSLAQKQQRMAPLEEELKNLRTGLHERGEKISQIERDCEELQKYVQDLSILKVRCEERLASASSRKKELESQILSLAQKDAEGRRELRGLEEELKRRLKQKDDLEQHHDHLEKKKNSWEEKRNRINQDWELANREFLEASHKKASLISRIQEVKNQKEMLRQRQENIEKRGEEEKRRVAELKEQIQERTRRCHFHASSLQKVLQEISLHQSRLQNLRNEKEKLASSIRKVLEKIQGAEMRLGFLKEAEEARDGYEKGVREILRALAEGILSRREILGLVEEIFSIESEYTAALDVALGRAAHYFVCTTPEAAHRGVDYLKSLGAGRASFLPLTALARWAEKEYLPRFKDESKILGRAADLVRCSPEYRNVAEFLLGRTFFARDLKSARHFAESNQYRVRVVTLEGDLIQPGGLITGGKLSPRFSASFHRKQEIARISAQLFKDQQGLELLKKQEECLNSEISHLERKLRELESLRLSREMEKSEEEQQLFFLTQELKQLTEFTQKLFSEGEVRGQLENLDQLVAGLEQELAEVLEKERGLERRRGEVEEARLFCEKKLQALEKEITALKVELGSLNQELKHLVQRKCQIQDLLTQQDGLIEKLKGELEKVSQEMQELQNQERETREKLSEIENKRNILEGELSFRKKQFRARKAYLTAKEKRYQKIKQKIGQYQQQLRSMELQLNHLEEQTEQLLTEAREYGVDLREIKNSREMGDQEKNLIKEKIAELKERLESLGEVNFTAPGELRALEERLSFLRQQKKDLEEGKEALHRVIREMDQIVVSRFHKTYREVRENFEEIFSILCEGGRAELLLTDEKNPLEAGLEVVVLPRGKKPRHLSLLSGGEKALAGITFLFALLKTRPSPFYFLDEIEAFLDEANIARFTNFLKKMGESSQLILISHRYQTMQVADTLYGITMEEPGISKIVSVNLTDSKWVRAG